MGWTFFLYSKPYWIVKNYTSQHDMDFFNSISFLLKVNHFSFLHQPFPYYDSLSLPPEPPFPNFFHKHSCSSSGSSYDTTCSCTNSSHPCTLQCCEYTSRSHCWSIKDWLHRCCSRTNSNPPSSKASSTKDHWSCCNSSSADCCTKSQIFPSPWSSFVEK